MIQELIGQLNNEQLKAVKSTINCDTLLLAGPGSGKTRVLQTRYLYLVKACKVSPYNILAFTFTNKAANELKERISSGLCEIELNQSTIGTFHGICVKFLHTYSKLIGIDNFTITDPGDTKKTIKHIADDLNIEADKTRMFGIISAISGLKDKLLTPDMAFAQAVNKFERENAMIYQKYQAYLESHHLMDFDDIVVNIVKALENNPDFRKIINDRYKYIMVDEVQDTNEVQHRLISCLGNNSNNVFMVG